jgi:uncharacterized protein YbaA (DUF1428 family)
MTKNTTKYVDGFVLVIPKKNVPAYKKMAKEASVVWKKFGALSYRECMIEDPKPQWVTLTFNKLIKAKPSETVWFSYIEYKNKKHRDAVNTKVMAHFDKKYTEEGQRMAMPFDMKRMSYGGFTVEVGA